MAECKNFTINRKSTKTFELTFTKNGLAVDITGWTIYLTVKKKKTDSDINAVIKKKVTIHSDPAGGKSLIELTTSDTDLTGSYHHSIDYKDNSTPPNEDVLFDGRINFENVTLQTRD